MTAAGHERHADEVATYALGALSELEAAAFERHLNQCETCSAELQRLRPVGDALAGAVPPVRAPAGLKRTVMAAIPHDGATAPRRSWLRRRPRASRALPRLAPALAGALAAAALALGAYGLGQALDDRDTQLTTASVDAARIPGASALFASEEDLGVLRASGLPRLEQGRVYVVWVDRGAGPIYSSSFNVSARGTAEAGVADLNGVERVMVTRERSAAVTKPSEQPVLTVDPS